METSCSEEIYLKTPVVGQQRDVLFHGLLAGFLEASS